MEAKKYYLGLDIGTDSVGYAVTDTKYDVLKYRGEPAWGVHLFDAANLCTDRRAFRTARRRLDRRQQRVRLVQELFAREVAKVDPRFFIRQQESALYPVDKNEKYSLFNDVGYTDREYHWQYPTIHHLIKTLMTSDGPFDVRLVYLACAWLVAHRGHFLNEIDKRNVAGITDFSVVYDALMTFFADKDCSAPWEKDCDPAAFSAAIRRKASLTVKYKSLSAACFGTKKVPKDPMETVFPYRCDVLLKCLCGSTVKAGELFDNEAYDEVRSFSLGSDDETLAEVLSAIGDDAELILRLKAIYRSC